jgi:hypothetical protein
MGFNLSVAEACQVASQLAVGLFSGLVVQVSSSSPSLTYATSPFLSRSLLWAFLLFDWWCRQTPKIHSLGPVISKCHFQLGLVNVRSLPLPLHPSVLFLLPSSQ